MVEFTIAADRTTVWHGPDGRRFATRIGSRRRQGIGRFVMAASETLPVTVKLGQMEGRIHQKVFTCRTDGIVKVGLTYRSYFILMQMEDVTESIRRRILTRHTNTA